MTAVSVTNSATPSATYTGIKRPAITDFAELNPLDKIGYSCASEAVDDHQYLTNWNKDVFVLDWAPVASSWTGATLTKDKEDNYPNDPAGNMKLSLTTPVSVPVGSKIAFTSGSSSLGANSICGINNASNAIVTPCENDGTGSMKCPVDVAGTSFVICCYNVAIVDTVTVATLKVLFPTSSATYVSETIYENTNVPINWTTGTLPAIKNGAITKLSYAQSSQDQGYGKATFEILLGREPVRGSKFTLNLDLTGFTIANVTPRCFPRFKSETTPFGTEPELGDALIDSCNVNLASTTNTLSVNFKNIAYKCTQSFNKTIFVTLWPVRIFNFGVTAKNYSITQTWTGDTTALADNSKTLPLNALGSTLSTTKPLVENQDALCAISSIVPRIPGEIADYTFDIDLDTGKDKLGANSSPNELTIFFPYQYYGSWQNQITCWNDITQVQCFFTDEGILSIRLGSALPVGSAKKIPIKVVGIVNPTLDGDTYFACTVNSLAITIANERSYARTVLATGSGKIAGGITVAAFTTQGGLKFLYVKDPVTAPKAPRETSTTTLRVALDQAIGYTNPAISFATAAVFIIQFPSEYNLAWWAGNKVTATVEEFKVVSTQDTTKTPPVTTTEVKGGSPITATVTQSGNRVTLTLPNNTYSLDASFQFWEIKLSSVANPIHQQITTRPFKVFLTNTAGNALYRTYTNANAYQGNAVSSVGESPLGWNRGITFAFSDTTKHSVDFAHTDAGYFNNRLTIKPGRYISAQIIPRLSDTKNAAPGKTTITLADTTFKTSATSYDIVTAKNEAVKMWIGTSCTTTMGQYIINFTQTDNAGFLPLPPVFVTVDDSSKATVTYNAPAAIAPGASAWISYQLSEVNFDELNIGWGSADGVTNDASASISTIVVPAGTPTNATRPPAAWSTLAVTSTSQTLANQSFKASSINSCYAITPTTYTVAVNAAATAFPAEATTANSQFRYVVPDDASYANARNTLKFVFTPVATPVYVHCALVCSAMTLPADNVLAIKSFADYSKVTPPQSNLVRYYYDYIHSAPQPITITFGELIRGQQYKLKCLVQTPQADVAARKTLPATIETHTIPATQTANATTINLIPTPPASTQCALFNFVGDPGADARKAAINYCQKIFSAPGWTNNGCHVCTDPDLQYTPLGLSLNTTTCVATAKARLRFLQPAPAPAPTPAPAPAPVSFAVCPVAHALCPTDATAGSKLFKAYYDEFTNALKTKAAIETATGVKNIAVNETAPFTTISDGAVPDQTKVSVAIGASDATGKVEWTTSTTLGSLQCYWQIAPQGTAAPSFSAIKTCTDAAWCGKDKVTGTATKSGTKTLKAFTAGTSYTLFWACTNDIPFAQKATATYSAGTIAIPAVSPSPSPVTPTCPDPTKVYPNCNSSFINMSLFGIMLLLALLF